jgi:uncharacterized protein (DUF2126 family)/transglutaminase-like putative cysteine protease
MAIRVALNHRTRYRFDRPVNIAPHEIRLRPAPHCRTPILSYSLTITPEKQFINWQQDAYGNFVARLTFPEKARELSVEVDLVADMTVINPFDFFVESYAETYPFTYPAQLASELTSYLITEQVGPRFSAWLATLRTQLAARKITITDFLVEINRQVQKDVAYLVRMEPGVQTCDQTLERGSGSCRDSGWMLVQALRHLGIAARFVSGYLIQLVADLKALDGPSGPTSDFTDLHAWAEAYIPGAGWVGLDPTSGLLAGEGHIPLACSASPWSAAPVIGATDICEVQFDFSMKITRVQEESRVTKPYSAIQWAAIDRLGRKVDEELAINDVRLTQGGEPTFVSIDDLDGPEWNFTAHSPAKFELASSLAQRLWKRFAKGGVLHFAQGKWYPGEPLPRWALNILWRNDGQPVWRDESLIALKASKDSAVTPEQFGRALAEQLGLHPDYVIPAFEDVWINVQQEGKLPVNVDPLKHDLESVDERARLARLLERGLGTVAGVVLPLRALPGKPGDQHTDWQSSPWPLRREHMYLIPGDAPVGFRLPLGSLPELLPEEVEHDFARDPFDPRDDLHDPHVVALKKRKVVTGAKPNHVPKPREVVRTALCIQRRHDILHVFLPPVKMLEDFLNMVAAIEAVAAQLHTPVRLEGYPPPSDPRMKSLSVTPDPGVIEVNIHPSDSWDSLCTHVIALYEDARQVRLGTEKFMLDGHHAGTGGGNHVTLGGATPADSPFLRRPDLLMSLLTYWQNHPALSYLFSGTFIGPTSQAPRVDEARNDSLYELEIAFQQLRKKVPESKESEQPWLIDRLLRNLLIDVTGNTHRAEFCIDKLYSPDGPTGRLGLLELRAFEMPPHAQMSLTQMLLLRTLIARFWKSPYLGKLVRWRTQLHDRFMLPHFIAEDMRAIVRDLNADGYEFDMGWFAPFLEFRFPFCGKVTYEGIELELRQAIEPWHVLGEQVAMGGMSRYVDSSVERLQVRVTGMIDTRHVVLCNGRLVPLQPTGVEGEYVAGVRFRAWNPPSALHPTIGVHSPLTFDLVDTWNARAIGGCTYHVVHPGGRNYDTRPVNSNEAEARRRSRFWDYGHTPGATEFHQELPNPDFPFTLDLRRSGEF